MNHDSRSPLARRPTVPILIVILAAVVMGLPTLRGGFVGGDDHRLVLNHVLVNHPSLAHAVQLFTIVHRDLYQPLPLLTFSGEFAIANVLGAFDGGIEGGAWLFHLTNVLLHAFNTLLVWLLVRMFQQRIGASNIAVATVAALLFAVHPFQVEVVAWVNGRMMLLSTLFALASILTFFRWLEASRFRYAILTLVFVLFSSLSKVRVGLPLLLGLAALIQGQRLRSRFWSLWLPCAALTGGFVWINIDATAGADLFAEGAENLRGPVLVRVLLALAFYFQHLVWPVGLTSYYPTPPEVHWSDASTGVAAIIVAFSAAVLALLCRTSRPCRWGALWFFIAVADTLPFIPARNILAADRYMYLPIVGLLWCLALAACDAYTRRRIRSTSRTPRIAVASASLLVLSAMIGQSWFTAKWYNTSLLKTRRVADCFPNEPRVWEKLGWCYYQAGDYDKASECARRELAFDNPSVRSGAFQLMGLSSLKQGDHDEALRLLHLALEIDRDRDIGLYRLATAYDDLGRLDEALFYYEAAAEAAPLHNPTLYHLGVAYRRVGRNADARTAFERQLANNPYDVSAVNALVELDIELGTRGAFLAAERRLLNLLRDLPHEAPLRINLGVVQYHLGRIDQAIDAYTQVLRRDPNNVTAALNLSQLGLSGDIDRAQAAGAALSRATDALPTVNAALAYAALGEGRFDEAVSRVATLGRDDNADDARRLLLAALERFDQQRPDVPWTLGLTAELLFADGQTQAAAAFLDLFQTRCGAPQCHDYARSLSRRLSPTPTLVPKPINSVP